MTNHTRTETGLNMYRKGQEVSISASSIENPFKFDGIMNAEKGMSDFLYEIPFGNFLIVSGFIFFNKQKHTASAVNVYLEYIAVYHQSWTGFSRAQILCI